MTAFITLRKKTRQTEQPKTSRKRNRERERVKRCGRNHSLDGLRIHLQIILYYYLMLRFCDKGKYKKTNNISLNHCLLITEEKKRV